MVGTTRSWGAAVGAVAVVAAGLTVVTGPQATAADWSRCLQGGDERALAFERAAEVSGVPEQVLLGVSYMQSRWDDHGDSPSTSSGYGPMHLVSLDEHAEAERHAQGKGESDAAEDAHAHAHAADGARTDSPGVDLEKDSLHTLELAAELVDVAPARLRGDDVANICGGAALLATYQQDLAPEDASAADAESWSAAVAKYSGATDEATAMRFAEQVFTVLREGRTRVTNDGHRVELAPSDADLDRVAVRSMGLTEAPSEGVDCPTGLGCESIPAPYEWYGAPNPGRYGNHDLADRQQDMDIDYIIIHDTEASWDTTLDLVTRPNYLAWNYSLRSRDGHIAQHLDSSDVGWHAGNWYVNTHSIGLEHEGFAAQGASWYTEAMYQTSATLVRYLAAKYDVPLDRAHVIGHDQIPGHIPARVPAMHWDPGPYWDWEHYFDLLGAPIGGETDDDADEAEEVLDDLDDLERGDLVTVAPGFAGNAQPITGCGSQPCNTENTNFVYLRSAPSETAPFVNDPGLRPDGSPQTDRVSDIGARAAAGHEFQVAKVKRDWLGVWWLGEIAWLPLRNAQGLPTVRPLEERRVVVPAGDAEVPVYGRAYPESSAYPAEIPDQGIAPLQYTLKPGQSYVVGDDSIETDYYYAKTYECAHRALDCTQVVGQDRYYLIWFGHRMAYVRAADVRLEDADD